MAKRLSLREVVVEPDPTNPASISAADLATMEAGVENTDELLFMEYCKNGDMKGFIQKCVDKNSDVSPKYLWLIFSCRKMLIESACRRGPWSYQI